MRRALAIGLLSLGACSRLLDFSEVTGGETADAGGEPVLVASLSGCHSISADDSGSIAYVTRYRLSPDEADGGVYRIDLGSGKATPLALGQAGAAWIARIGDDLYWTTEQVPRGVWRVDLTDTAAVPQLVYPAPGDTTARRPFGLAVLGQHVYFADRNGVIGRVSAETDDLELLYPSLGVPAFTLAILDGFIYFTERDLNLAADATPVHKVRRVPLVPPGQPETVTTGLHNVWGIVAHRVPDSADVETPHVFVSVSNGAAIARATGANGFETTTVGNAIGVMAPGGADILLVDDRLFWATRLGIGGAIQEYRLGAIGNAETFATSNQPTGLARVGDQLYWCSHAFGLVRQRL